MENWSTVVVSVVTAISGFAIAYLPHRLEMRKMRKAQSKKDDAMVERIGKIEEEQKTVPACQQVAQQLQAVYDSHNRSATKTIRNRASGDLNEEIIYPAMHGLRKEFNFDRVYAWVVHPRERAMYASVVYESVAEGVAKITPMNIDVELSNFPSIISELNQKAFVYALDAQKEIKDDNFVGKLMNGGTESVFACKMLGQDGRLIGYLVCEYMHVSDGRNLGVIRASMANTAIKIKNLIPDIM